MDLRFAVKHSVTPNVDVTLADGVIPSYEEHQDVDNRLKTLEDEYDMISQQFELLNENMVKLIRALGGGGSSDGSGGSGSGSGSGNASSDELISITIHATNLDENSTYTIYDAEIGDNITMENGRSYTVKTKSTDSQVVEVSGPDGTSKIYVSKYATDNADITIDGVAKTAKSGKPEESDGEHPEFVTLSIYSNKLATGRLYRVLDDDVNYGVIFRGELSEDQPEEFTVRYGTTLRVESIPAESESATLGTVEMFTFPGKITTQAYLHYDGPGDVEQDDKQNAEGDDSGESSPEEQADNYKWFSHSYSGVNETSAALTAAIKNNCGLLVFICKPGCEFCKAVWSERYEGQEMLDGDGKMAQYLKTNKLVGLRIDDSMGHYSDLAGGVGGYRNPDGTATNTESPFLVLVKVKADAGNDNNFELTRRKASIEKFFGGYGSLTIFDKTYAKVSAWLDGLLASDVYKNAFSGESGSDDSGTEPAEEPTTDPRQVYYLKYNDLTETINLGGDKSAHWDSSESRVLPASSYKKYYSGDPVTVSRINTGSNTMFHIGDNVWFYIAIEKGWTEEDHNLISISTSDVSASDPPGTVYEYNVSLTSKDSFNVTFVGKTSPTT